MLCSPCVLQSVGGEKNMWRHISNGGAGAWTAGDPVALGTSRFLIHDRGDGPLADYFQ